MRSMQSFLIFFYLLDQCYWQCYCQGREDDLPWFLGAICPELWEDGKPIDGAIFEEWKQFIDSGAVDMDNIMEKSGSFLQFYEQKFGFHFDKAIQWLLATTDKAVVEKAFHRAELMYQKYQYDD